MHIRHPFNNQSDYEVRYPGYKRAEIDNFFRTLVKNGVMNHVVTLPPIEFAIYPYWRNLIIRFWTIGDAQGNIIATGEIHNYGEQYARIRRHDIPVLNDLIITIQ